MIDNLSTHRDDLSKFLIQYGIHDANVVQLGPNRYQIDGPNGVCEARLVSPTSAKLRLFVTDALARYRYRDTQRLLLTLYDERYVPFDETRVMYLTDTWPSLDFETDPDSVVAVAVLLAQLHDALASISAHPLRALGDSIRTGYGTWLGSLTNGLQAIGAEHTKAKIRGFDDSLLAHAYSHAERAIQRLKDAGYVSVSERAKDACALAWGGIKMQAFGATKAGRARLFQLVDPVRDTPLLDLAELCAAVFEQKSKSDVVRALDAYHAHKPLQALERQVVLACAAYPHAAVRYTRSLRKQAQGPSIVLSAEREAATRSMIERQLATSAPFL